MFRYSDAPDDRNPLLFPDIEVQILIVCPGALAKSGFGNKI